MTQRDKSICICARERINSGKKEKARFIWNLNTHGTLIPGVAGDEGKWSRWEGSWVPRVPYVPHLSAFLPTHFHPF